MASVRPLWLVASRKLGRKLSVWIPKPSGSGIRNVSDFGAVGSTSSASPRRVGSGTHGDFGVSHMGLRPTHGDESPFSENP